MSNPIVFTLVFIFFLQNLRAQSPEKMDLNPCGTPAYLDPWLKKYLAEEIPVANRSSDTLFVALKIHLLANDNGQFRLSADKFLNAFCRLNSDFGGAKIQFYVKDDWNFINKTKWYDHNEISGGIEMMLTNNVPDAINAYFVSDPAGNCGYNLPYGGVAIGHNCAGANDHTWAHEIGHALTLPHPFIGWEGKTYNFNNPTPLSLTYDYTDFHAQPDTVHPAPLDTALVEFLDKSNCTAAADRFCDTKPDYLSYRWDCDSQNLSTTKQRDPAGAEFFSDGTMFMGYSFDHCQNRFTPDEIAAMRANLQTVKSNYLAPAAVAQPITDSPELLSPIAGQLVPKEGFTFEWAAVSNAEKYVVQGSRVASFAFRDFEAVVSGTSFTSGVLPANSNMYWRVRPFNSIYACTGFTEKANFKTAAVSDATDFYIEKTVRVYPSLLSAGDPIFIDFKNNEIRKLTTRITDLHGKTVWEGNFEPSFSTFQLPLKTDNLSAGVYRLLIVLDEKVEVKTIVIL